MRSFMSSFAAFAIHASGWKAKVSDPVRREKFFDTLRRKNQKPGRLPPFPYRSKPEEQMMDGVKVITMHKGGSKKLIYLHGGAYCEPPRILHFIFCDRVAANTDYEILFPLYHRAPSSTFEGTFQFLEKLYRGLLEKTKPEDIVFMGDSSGGGLALAFCEHLKVLKLAQPGRMILLSPWLDAAMDQPFSKAFDKLDPSLQRDYLQTAAKYWAGETDVHDYRISPIFGDFKDLAPITLYAGSYEAIVPSIRTFRDRCAALGVSLDYREWAEMNHVFVVYPIPEANKAQKEIIALLNESQKQHKKRATR